MNFNSVKSNIQERLLSSEWHPEQLKRLVKVKVAADVWRTWYIDLSSLLGRPSMVAVTYDLMLIWGVVPDDLEMAACANAAGNYRIQDMGEIVGFMLETPVPDHTTICIISNDAGFYGAISVLNKEVQTVLSERFPDGYYVLLSSVHECIAVSGEVDSRDLARMVFTVNRVNIQEYNRLSDHVFKIENGQLVVVA